MENTKPGLVTLSDFLRGLRDDLRRQYPESYWISGETSGVKVYKNAIYFDLLELKNGQKLAQIKVSAFTEGMQVIRQFEQMTGQKLVPGLKIGGRFGVNFHAVSGMSLVLQELDPEMTLGGIELQRQQTLQRLLAKYPEHIKLREGEYWSANKALPIAPVLQKIAVISSANAEGYHDFVHTLDHNEYGIKFNHQLFVTTVHGALAASDIVNAFRNVYESGQRFDAIVLIRGGGAPGDLLPYDDERLGAVIARARFPVVTGIGHHNNQGIADLLAAVHEKTPTAAAKYLVDRACEFQQRLKLLAVNIGTAARNTVGLRQQKLSRYITLIDVHADHRIKMQQQILAGLLPQITEAATRNLFQQKNRLTNINENIQNLSPLRTLKRGFAIVRKGTQIITDAADLSPGENVHITFERAEAEVTINTIRNGRTNL